MVAFIAVGIVAYHFGLGWYSALLALAALDCSSPSITRIAEAVARKGSA